MHMKLYVQEFYSLSEKLGGLWIGSTSPNYLADIRIIVNLVQISVLRVPEMVHIALIQTLASLVTFHNLS